MSILYLVGTPIGNLGDFSPRAVEILSSVDFIAAEDTRVTLKLLNHFKISTPMISYYQHNMHEKGNEIADRISGGESCALVTDAGMPAISDPGEDLVKICARRGITVAAVPGPAAAVTALAMSGLPTGRFTFEGFLSVNKQSRRDHLSSLIRESRTMIFYEAPHKLRSTLADFSEIFGENRKISICRELTKIYEQVIRTTLGEAVKLYEETTPKGEFVLVIEGAKESEGSASTLEEAAKLALELMEKGESAANAAKQAAKLTGFKKGDIYRLLL